MKIIQRTSDIILEVFRAGQNFHLYTGYAYHCQNNLDASVILELFNRQIKLFILTTFVCSIFVLDSEFVLNDST